VRAPARRASDALNALNPGSTISCTSLAKHGDQPCGAAAIPSINGWVMVFVATKS
jgi:hypothetical protein